MHLFIHYFYFNPLPVQSHVIISSIPCLTKLFEFLKRFISWELHWYCRYLNDYIFLWFGKLIQLLGDTLFQWFLFSVTLTMNIQKSVIFSCLCKFIFNISISPMCILILLVTLNTIFYKLLQQQLENRIFY